ncbi:MAG: NAD(P)-dependent oxidoreductase [Terriglobia bacterium]
MRVLFLGIPNQLHPWYDDVLKAVGSRWPIELFDPGRPKAEQFRGVDVVVDQGGQFGKREMIDLGAAAQVKLWQVLGVGVDHVDIRYLLEKKIPLANTPGPSSAVALAEHSLFLMLLFAKNFAESQKNIQAKILCYPLNDELEGKTLGLLGLGASGRSLAKRAKAMGMRIMATDMVQAPPEVLQECQLDFFGSQEHMGRVLQEADYYSIHVPLTSKTRHMVSRNELKLMKPTAVVINIARGGVIDEEALAEALREGKLRGAGLDVFSKEPVDPQHPLLQCSNVIATPHIAGVTTGTSRRRGEAVAENIDRTSRGLPPLFQITSVE